MEENSVRIIKVMVAENNSDCTTCTPKAKVRSRSHSGSRACDRATDNGEGEGGYDIILMSETVYNLSSLPKLYSLIKKVSCLVLSRHSCALKTEHQHYCMPSSLLVWFFFSV